MTQDQLAKMRAGKEAAQERQRHEWAEQQRAFVDWIEREHVAHDLKEMAEEVYGRDSDEFRMAYRMWSEQLKQMPKPPPDHGWTR